MAGRIVACKLLASHVSRKNKVSRCKITITVDYVLCVFWSVWFYQLVYAFKKGTETLWWQLTNTPVIMWCTSSNSLLVLLHPFSLHSATSLFTESPVLTLYEKWHVWCDIYFKKKQCTLKFCFRTLVSEPSSIKNTSKSTIHFILCVFEILSADQHSKFHFYSI